MKIALLSAFYEPYMSGAEQMVKEIAERLGKEHEIHLITGRFDKTLAKTEERANFKLIRLGIGHKQIDKILYPFLAAWETKKIKADIAHAIMESYAGGALIVLKFIAPSIPRLLTLQSGNLEDDVKQSKFLVKLFYRMIHNAPNRITAISNYLAKRLERLNIDKGEVSITPNGIDFSEVPEGIDPIKNRAVFVGRLSYEKGLDHLLNAWPAVTQAIPDARLVLVGPDGDAAEIVKTLAKELNLSDTVTFTGGMPHGEALKEIKKSEIFICPSLAEGLGNVFIEAQACGVPPIGTRVGGIPDIIDNEKTGLLIESKSPEAISAAIIRLLCDKTLYTEIKNNVVASARRFEWDAIIKKIDNIYKEIKA